MAVIMFDPTDTTSCDAYLGSRTGRYEYRCQRYDRALDAIIQAGISAEDTVVDIGAGWTEFAARMFSNEHLQTTQIRPRYFPVDGCLDGTNLETWIPPRTAEWFVALEILEHLTHPERLVRLMQRNAKKGIVVSCPNPETVDVLGMDSTHRTVIHAYDLESWGFNVERNSFYGAKNDALFAFWTP